MKKSSIQRAMRQAIKDKADAEFQLQYIDEVMQDLRNKRKHWRGRREKALAQIRRLACEVPS